MTKKENGITLIALVITIIVLLILAAVTIAMLTGENGILTKATGASDETRISAIKESLSLAYSTITANKLDPSYTDEAKLNTFSSDNVAKVIKADDASTQAEKVEENNEETTKGKITYVYSSKTYTVEFEWLKADEEIIGINLDKVTINP